MGVRGAGKLSGFMVSEWGLTEGETGAEWRIFEVRIWGMLVGQQGRVSRQLVEAGAARGRAIAVTNATAERWQNQVRFEVSQATPFRGAGGFSLGEEKMAGRWQASHLGLRLRHSDVDVDVVQGAVGRPCEAAKSHPRIFVIENENQGWPELADPLEERRRRAGEKQSSLFSAHADVPASPGGCSPRFPGAFRKPARASC